MRMDLRKFPAGMLLRVSRPLLRSKALTTIRGPSLGAKVHRIAVWIEERRSLVRRLVRRGGIVRTHQFDENRLNVSAIGAADREF